MINELNKVKNIVKIVALIFGIVAFCMMFVEQIMYVVPFGSDYEVPLYFRQVFFGNHTGSIVYSGTILPFLGYIFIIVFSIVPIVITLIFKKENRLSSIIIAISSLFIIAGCVLILNSKNFFLYANRASGEYEYLTCYILKGAIMAGILGLISGFGFLASIFIDDNKRLIEK